MSNLAALQIPVSCKRIGKFVKYSAETEKINPVVSYYCLLFALEKGLELRDKTDPVANQFIKVLLDECETKKNALDGTMEDHRAIFEEFALNMFQIADDEDRSGNATKDTAKQFFAAYSYLEASEIFGPLPSDLDEKRRYAMKKTTMILDSVKQGKKPEPGIPGVAGEQAAKELAQTYDSNAVHLHPTAGASVVGMGSMAVPVLTPSDPHGIQASYPALYPNIPTGPSGPSSAAKGSPNTSAGASMYPGLGGGAAVPSADPKSSYPNLPSSMYGYPDLGANAPLMGAYPGFGDASAPPESDSSGSKVDLAGAAPKPGDMPGGYPGLFGYPVSDAASPHDVKSSEPSSKGSTGSYPALNYGGNVLGAGTPPPGGAPPAQKYNPLHAMKGGQPGQPPAGGAGGGPKPAYSSPASYTSNQSSVGPATTPGYPTPVPNPAMYSAPAGHDTGMVATATVATAAAVVAVPSVPGRIKIVQKPGYDISFGNYTQAQKLAKSASSALDFQDARTAISDLKKALALLTGQEIE
eukprot:CAMPEP_0184691372 /NCGR_PEP_ID=MMETSP0313-20130426/252_1 /TAXON_ID=2792 /ORGANISM="Porphyridium aerugineum, Strain SAG 1380-2" /LENGTH=523 /DNA_ID=CAMNT_0027149073 /DNA_START=226 /DNA_END=1797 /DNA_ORIENTATION=-